MKLSLLCEAGYGRIWGTRYSGFHVDPKPNVLILGKWKHPRTKITSVGGINLNYLKGDQVGRLQVALPKILSVKNLKSRYWAGKELVPDVFDVAYRTYNKSKITPVSADTLKFAKTPEGAEKAKVAAKKGWETRRGKAKPEEPEKPEEKPIEPVEPEPEEPDTGAEEPELDEPEGLP
jgi:hypothetical protein